MSRHKNPEPGLVYWITGLAGSGKTTIGRALYQQLCLLKRKVIFLDGDEMRWVLGKTKEFSRAERLDLARIYSRQCKMLADQGHDVVCATISLFKEVHAYNRELLSRYMEVFIECSPEELSRRNQKGIYQAGDNVVGVSIPYDRPLGCHLVIDNTQADACMEKVQQILSLTFPPRSHGFVHPTSFRQEGAYEHA